MVARLAVLVARLAVSLPICDTRTSGGWVPVRQRIIAYPTTERD